MLDQVRGGSQDARVVLFQPLQIGQRISPGEPIEVRQFAAQFGILYNYEMPHLAVGAARRFGRRLKYLVQQFARHRVRLEVSDSPLCEHRLEQPNFVSHSASSIFVEPSL